MNPMRQTRISITGSQWHINDRVTGPGTPVEGLLMNVRMANAVFEDLAHPDFDAEENSARFIAHIPDYVAHGIRAFTLCLQGGFPGYEGAVNSAFNADGSLRSSYLNRVARVIEACDQIGVVVILGCYYQRQVHLLADENAIRVGVVNVAQWIQAQGFTNVVVETTNEFGHRGFTHPIFISPEGQVELIRLVKETAPDLLVSASRQGHKGMIDSVCQVSDFILVHFNHVSIEEVPALVGSLNKYGKPIICNEDRKLGEEGAQMAEVCVANDCSWGLMAREINQYNPPFRFNGPQDDLTVYAKLKQLAFPAT